MYQQETDYKYQWYAGQFEQIQNFTERSFGLKNTKDSPAELPRFHLRVRFCLWKNASRLCFLAHDHLGAVSGFGFDTGSPSALSTYVLS